MGNAEYMGTYLAVKGRCKFFKIEITWKIVSSAHTFA